jgi:hypothetical protein
VQLLILFFLEEGIPWLVGRRRASPGKPVFENVDKRAGSEKCGKVIWMCHLHSGCAVVDKFCGGDIGDANFSSFLFSAFSWSGGVGRQEAGRP